MLTGRCWIRWLCAMLVAAMAETAVAGVVVNWGGDYFTNWNSLHPGPPTGNGNGNDIYGDPVVGFEAGGGQYLSGRSVNDDTQYSPTYPASNSNLNFYGGHALLSTDKKESVQRLGIEGQGNSDDELHVDAQPSNTLEKFAMLAYWKVSSTALSTSSMFSLASKQDAQGEGGHTLRWVVGRGTTFYISSNELAFSNNSPYQSVVGSLNWKVYAPLSTGVGVGADLEKVFYKSSLSNYTGAFDGVTAVGFYVEYDRPDALNGNPARGVNYKITGFKVDSVPEPSTFLLGLAGFGGVALKRWRQRRKSGGTDAAQLTEAAT